MRISNIIAGWAILIAPVALAAPTQQQDQATAISAKEPIQPRHIPETASGTPASPGNAPIGLPWTVEVLEALEESTRQAFCPCKYGKLEKEMPVTVNVYVTREEFEETWNSFCPCQSTSHLILHFKNENKAASPGLARRATLFIGEDVPPAQDLDWTLDALEALSEPSRQRFCPCKYGKPEQPGNVRITNTEVTRENFNQIWETFCSCMDTSHIILNWGNENKAASPGIARRATLSIEEHSNPGNTAKPIQPRQHPVKVEGESFSKAMEQLCPCMYGEDKSAKPASVSLNPKYEKFAEFLKKFKEDFEKDCPCMSFSDIKMNLDSADSGKPGLARRATFSIGSIEEAIQPRNDAGHSTKAGSL